MSKIKFLNKFGKEKVLLPVIHVQSKSQLSRNLDICFDNNVDGVWLINHGDVDDKEIYQYYYELSKDYTHIGINLLSYYPENAIKITLNDTLGVWIDFAGIIDNDVVIANIIKENNKLQDSLYFGGVAFKYQRQPTNLKLTCENAMNYVDVITTSGDGTGIEADVEKIKRIREYSNDFPIALASGITPGNARKYLPYVNAFMVASGINKENDFYNIDEEKLKSLKDQIESYSC